MSLVGNLEDLGLGEILQIVSLSRKSGVLTIRSRGREGRVVFQNGQVTQAVSSAFQQSIGEVLIRKGIIDLSMLRAGLDRQEREGYRERLGSILTRLFDIPKEEIEEVGRELIENVVYSLFEWAEGTFDFDIREVADLPGSVKSDPLQFMLGRGLNPQFLAMEGSRLVDEKRHAGEAESGSEELDVDLAFDLMAEQAPAASAKPVPLVLVDDDGEVRDALAAVLADEGYEVSALGRSEEALIRTDILYRDGERPILVIDLLMPRMDGSGAFGGLELMDLGRNNFPELPILIVSDQRNEDAETRIRERGCSFLLKPTREAWGDPARVAAFGRTLLDALQQLRSGEGEREVNLGEALRREFGDIRPESPPVSAGISHLRGMLAELHSPDLGEGVPLLLLRFAADFIGRGVLFSAGEGEFRGVGQFGCDMDAGSRIATLFIPAGEGSLLDSALTAGAAYRGVPDDTSWNRRLFELLGGGKPAEVFVAPVLNDGKVVAVLYGDNLPDAGTIGDTESLELFLSQSGAALERGLRQELSSKNKRVRA